MKYTDREVKLVQACVNYAGNDPPGLPGHNLMVIIAKLVTGTPTDMHDLKLKLPGFNAHERAQTEEPSSTHRYSDSFTPLLDDNE